MLKKILKGCLVATCACTISTPTMAMGLVTGVLSTAFGQENSARTDDEASHFAVHYLGSIGLEAIGKQMSAQIKLKVKTGGLDNYNGGELDYEASPVFDAEEMQVKYTPSDTLNVAIGDFDVPESHGYGDGYANATNPFIAGKYGQPTSWANGLGIVANFQVNDDIKAVVGLFATDPLRAAYRGDGCADYGTNPWSGTCVKNKDVPSQGGSGNMLAVEAAFGSIKTRFAMTNGSANDDADPDDEVITGTGMTITAMYTAVGAFEVGFDYGTLNQGNHYQDNDSRDLETQMAIFGGVPNIGPGMLKVLMASEKYQTDDGSDVTDVAVMSYTNIAYEIPMEPISQISIIYSSVTTDFEDTSLDAKTASFIGTSFKKVF